MSLHTQTKPGQDKRQNFISSRKKYLHHSYSYPSTEDLDFRSERGSRMRCCGWCLSGAPSCLSLSTSSAGTAIRELVSKSFLLSVQWHHIARTLTGQSAMAASIAALQLWCEEAGLLYKTTALVLNALSNISLLCLGFNGLQLNMLKCQKDTEREMSGWQALESF